MTKKIQYSKQDLLLKRISYQEQLNDIDNRFYKFDANLRDFVHSIDNAVDSKHLDDHMQDIKDGIKILHKYIDSLPRYAAPEPIDGNINQYEIKIVKKTNSLFVSPDENIIPATKETLTSLIELLVDKVDGEKND